MPSVLIPLAEGAEEMEAVILIDVLRRADWHVVSASLAAGPVVCSRCVRILPDTKWDEVDVEGFDALVLPGGAVGSDHLRRDPRVLTAIRSYVASGRVVAAVCAAPVALDAAGVLDGHRFTAHPTVRDRLPADGYCEESVIEDGSIITSRGPGTTFDLALTLIARLDSREKAISIAEAMLYKVAL